MLSNLATSTIAEIVVYPQTMFLLPLAVIVIVLIMVKVW